MGITILNPVTHFLRSYFQLSLSFALTCEKLWRSKWSSVYSFLSIHPCKSLWTCSVTILLFPSNSVPSKHLFMSCCSAFQKVKSSVEILLGTALQCRKIPRSMIIKCLSLQQKTLNWQNYRIFHRDLVWSVVKCSE